MTRASFATAAAVVVALTLVGARPQFAGAPAWKAVADGIEHAGIVGPSPRGGAWNINALRLDPARVRLDVVRARDRAIGVETVTSMARRHDALAAVNGGYFRTSGDFLGDSTGTLQIDGELVSEPDRGRASVGVVRGADADRLLFGHVVWRATIGSGRQSRRIDGVNRPRGPNELVVFTPHFGSAPLTDATGTEVTVAAGAVVDVREGAGQSPIPQDGYVLSGRGKSASWLRSTLTKGARVSLAMTVHPAGGSDQHQWSAAEDIVAAGPKLISNGRIEITDARERMIPGLRNGLHPRTAIASLADGRVVLVVVDGRRPPDRVGMTLDELARVLMELGAREAINLDGGGSSTMVVRGAIVNHPSDAAGERPVSDAIVVRARRPTP